MSSAAEAHLLQRIAAAPLEPEPFPHCVVDGAFPQDFYETILDEWPEDGEFQRLVETGRVGKSYSPSRLVIELHRGNWTRLGERAAFWREAIWPLLQGDALAQALCAKFADITGPRLASARGPMSRDAVLVSDRTGYALGPHTDAPHRLVSALFYLPLDRWSFADAIGTVLYRPKQPGFACEGGPSYQVDGFIPARRIAFLPNRLFMFPKTRTSFHGVEPVAVRGVDRRMLLFDLRLPA